MDDVTLPPTVSGDFLLFEGENHESLACAGLFKRNAGYSHKYLKRRTLKPPEMPTSSLNKKKTTFRHKNPQTNERNLNPPRARDSWA